jgi:acetyl-CoA carboxylase, biotin carboxylase subunit
MPFSKVLVANRGEIALRVIRACRELGIPTVAVYSQCDATSLHVRFADEAICIGPPPATDSYLNVHNVLSAALVTGADAIHPGYGFLAENADFARKVADHGITFIGPHPDTLLDFGDKLRAKEMARKAGTPLLPGSGGALADIGSATALAQAIGYPLMLKAVAGGGGKGMRVIENDGELIRAFPLATAESLAAFGNGALFMERFLRSPRHVEIQVAGDGQGGAIHLGERDCSLQRRHQKLIEEAPAPNLSDDLRARIRQAAVDLVRTANYCTVGTCEFLVEGEDFYFLEVNPRIQVEHPVTEEVTGVDLVKLQMRLAAGEPMPLTQEEVQLRGHAIEVRINAEHPFKFTPSPGVITGFHMPGGPGVRVDSAVHEQAMVQPFYDSLVAKVIVWGPTREAATARLRRVLRECVVEGIHTTLPLHRELIELDEWRDVTFHTKFVDGWVQTRG